MLQDATAPIEIEAAEEVLADLFGTAACIDPLTGEPQWRTAGSTLTRIAEHFSGGDAPVPFGISLWAHVYAADAIASILSEPRTRQIRSTSMQAVHRVRELDARCMTWLVKQPGRTVREKLHRGRARGVIRPQTVDSLENRLARQVCTLLAEEARHASHRSPDRGRHRDNAARSSALETLQHLCSRRLAASAICSLPAPASLSPNNVLLWDRRYGKIWRVWRRLSSMRSRQVRPATLQQGVLHALMWSAAAILVARGRATVEESLVRPRLWPVDQPWLVEECEDGPLRVRLTITAGAAAIEVLEFRIEGADRLVIEAEELVADGSAIRSGHRRSWQAIADVATQADGELACSLLVVPEHAGDGLEKAVPWTVAGLHTLGALIAEAVGSVDVEGGVVVTHPIGLDSPAPAGWTEAGWDLTGSRLLVAAPSRPSGVSTTPLQAALGSQQPARWLAGDDAARCHPLRSRYTAHQAWLRIENAGGHTPPEQLRELRAFSAALAVASTGEYRPDPAARLAISVPDYLDEAQIHVLRAALPSAAARRTIVWRSIATALDWRENGGGAALGPGDPILVLDLDGPSASATLLEMRADERPSADPVVWERIPSERPDEVARRASSREIEAATVHDALARYFGDQMRGTDVDYLAARVVDEGWLDAAIAAPGCKVFVREPTGETDLRGIAVTAEMLLEPLDTSRLLEERLSAWLSAVRRGTTWDLLAVSGRRPRALVLSRLCANDAARAQVIAAIECVLPEVDVQILHDPAGCARGGLVYLQRDAEGLPTWRDRLPDLYLDVRGGARVLLFQASAITPGQLVAHDAGQFDLSPGVRWYEFPLTRQQRGGTALPQRLWLEHQAFPLTKPIRVRIRVEFRYADDAFTIRVIPCGEAPFEQLELRWANAQGGFGERRVNDPPSLPPQLSWESENVGPLAQLRGHIARLAAIWAELGAGSFTVDAKQALSGGPAAKRLVGHLDAVRVELQALRDVVRRDVFVAARDAATLPEAVREEISGTLVPVLWQLAWLPDAHVATEKRNVAGRWSKPWTVIRDRRAPPVYHKLLEVEELALNTLSALRHMAPRQFVAVQLKRLDERRSPAPAVLLGRVAMVVADDLGQRAIDALLQLLDTSIRNRNARAARDPLWALAAALWSDRGAIYSLGRRRTRQVLTALLRVLRRLRDGWSSESVALELQSLATDLFFALTFLRGHFDGEVLSAGSPLMDRAAELVVRVDRIIRHARPYSTAPGSPRLEVNLANLPEFPHEVVPSPPAHALWATLRGEWNVRIEAVREE